MDRPGEKRPSIRCKQCKDEHCCQSAKVTSDFCTMMKGMGKSLWSCGECEAKETDMKAVLDSMRSIKSDLSTIHQKTDGTGGGKGESS